MDTSRINFVSHVITDPEIFRNDTSPLRYFTARRPALAHFRRAPRIDRYPGRLPRATIHELVSRLALPLLGARRRSPSPPRALGREKNKQGVALLHDSTSHGELERPRA